MRSLIMKQCDSKDPHPRHWWDDDETGKEVFCNGVPKDRK